MAEYPNFYNLTGDWDAYENGLYQIFCNFFDNSSLAKYNGEKIRYNKRASENRPEGYWHVTHRDAPNSVGRIDRIFDPERSRRIGWIKNLVCEDCTSCKIFWDKNRDKLHFWLEDDDYILILARQKRIHHGSNCLHLVTAFYIDGNGYRRKFSKMYKDYQKLEPPN